MSTPSTFRKRPVVVAAIRFGYAEFADKVLPFHGEIPEWLSTALAEGTVAGEFKGEDYWYLRIETLEGPIYASPGDWLIRGVQGELYPCKPDIFAETYEPVTTTTWVHSCGRAVVRESGVPQSCTSCGEVGIWSATMEIGGGR